MQAALVVKPWYLESRQHEDAESYQQPAGYLAQQAEVEADPEAEPEAKSKEKAGFEWDKARQAADIAAANARKQTEEHQETISSLTKLVETLQAKADAKPGDTQAEDSAKKIDELLESLTKVDDDGELVATAADVAKVIREMRTIDAQNASSPKPSAEIEKVLKSVEELRAEMSDLKAEREAAESEAMLNTMLDGLDKKYGETYRTDCIKTVQDQLADQGLGADNLPHVDHVRLMLDAAYRDAFTNDPKNKGKSPAKVNVNVDSGKGGATIPTAPVCGDNDQVFEAMRASGEFG